MPKRKQMKFAPNTGYAFAVDKETWHSADPVGPEVTTRDSILLTYFVDAGALRFLRNRGKRIGNFLLNEFAARPADAGRRSVKALLTRARHRARMVTRRRLRTVLTALGLYLGAALLIGYFGVNAYTGNHGLNARQDLDQQMARLTVGTRRAQGRAPASGSGGWRCCKSAKPRSGHAGRARAGVARLCRIPAI